MAARSLKRYRPDMIQASVLNLFSLIEAKISALLMPQSSMFSLSSLTSNKFNSPQAKDIHVFKQAILL